ncbi:hypothetical protein LV92_03014 [Arenibacter echinorum]|uniref:Uncharacterized protein n=1 Tax=Arenibacter echinorum TaxID=440515 RepID=A0A327R1X8_9FLAO|nr:hypothetical protein LV92_03014 [Arenibacter echinorum]
MSYLIDLQAGGHWFEPSRAHSNKDKASKKLEAFFVGLENC